MDLIRGGFNKRRFRKCTRRFRSKQIGCNKRLDLLTVDLLTEFHCTFKLGNLFSYKNKQTTLSRSNVAYKLNCLCGRSYIGQIKRNLTSRLKEHHPGYKSKTQRDVTKHLLENPSHAINFNEPEILTTANYIKELLIKETLLTQQQLPSTNVDESSTPLNVFNDFIYVCFAVLFFTIF